MGSSDDSFVHLHVHTEYSMLDGAARLSDLFAEAARQGMPAMAMTDHGNVFGAYDFWKQARATGVKPIIGMEGYYVPVGTRFDRQPFELGGPGADTGGEDNAGLARGKQAYTHMTLLAESTEGMHNLFRLSSLASLEGQYRKPRFDRELLQTYGQGLIATTGCPSGEVNRWLQAGRYDKALAAAADYRDILGAGNFYVELMDHGLDIERRTRPDLVRLARELGLPLVATNDLHYTFPTDAEAHEVLLCVQTGKTLADPGRFRFDARDFYLKSAAEMRALWSELPEACDSTLAIAERCEVSFAEGRDLMPRFRCPGGGDRGVLAGQGGRARAGAAVPGRGPRPAPHPGAVRGRRHRPDGLPRLLPGRRRPVQVRQGEPDPGRARPRVGRRRGDRVRPGDHRARPDQARAGVRAVPQPRAHLDAGHRPGLRRAPALGHDPVRDREVRRGAGRADHHVRHDQGEGRGQGRRPRARLPLRHGRPDHQGDAAAGDGQGHLRSAASSTTPTAGTPRRASSERSTTPTRTSSASWTPPADSRGSSGSGGCTPPESSSARSRCSTSSPSSAASRTARSSPSWTWAPARRWAC